MRILIVEDDDVLRDGLEVGLSLAGFTSGANQNPLRLNLFRACGVTVLVDYAHNAAAYRALIDTARQLAERRVLGVVAAPGDRREQDLVEMGRLCQDGFDEVLLYEMDEARGRPPGATAALLLAALMPVAGSAVERREISNQAVATELFGTWVWPFEALSVLLLAALIAALAVSRGRGVSTGEGA